MTLPRGGWLNPYLKHPLPETHTALDVQKRSQPSHMMASLSTDTLTSGHGESRLVQEVLWWQIHLQINSQAHLEESQPINAPDRQHLKWAWSMPNQTPTDCNIATDMIVMKIEHDHRAYQSVYQMSLQETVEITTNRWSPISHRKQHSTEATYRDGIREVDQECAEDIIWLTLTIKWSTMTLLNTASRDGETCIYILQIGFLSAEVWF